MEKLDVAEAKVSVLYVEFLKFSIKGELIADSKAIL
jgi:hypothetical protein